MRRSLKSGFFILLSAAAVGTASARSVGYGDLIVGFLASSGTGSDTNVEVDVGAASYYIGAGPGTYTLANLNSDLTNTYGAGWANDAALSYSVVGTTLPGSGAFGAPAQTVWASSAEPSGSAAGTAAPSYLGTGGYSAANSAIGGVYGGNIGAFGGLDTTTLGDLSSQPAPFPGDTLIGITSTGSPAPAGSYTHQYQTGGVGFSIPAGNGVSLLAAVAGATGTSSADLYELFPTTAVGTDQRALGYFTLNNSGVLTYTVSLPEHPASAALIAAAVFGLMLPVRRGARYLLARA